MQQISWRAPEYIHTHKTADWYWIVGIVTLSIAIIAVIFNNLIFGILVIVAAATLSMHASRPPRKIDIVISQLGVRIGNVFYPYDELESFWIETEDMPTVIHPKIIFKSKKKLMFLITALLENQNPDEIEEYLAQHLPKIEHTEPFLEKLLVYFGF